MNYHEEELDKLLHILTNSLIKEREFVYNKNSRSFILGRNHNL